jgi:predicted dehydrogenase
VKELSFNKLEPMNNKFTSQDNLSIQLKYEDGSIGVIDYIAVGSKSFPKEFLEVHFDEKTIIVDNFKSIKGYGIKLKELSSQEPLKGHLEELEILNDSIKNKTLPIELNDLFTVTRLTYLLL